MRVPEDPPGTHRSNTTRQSQCMWQTTNACISSTTPSVYHSDTGPWAVGGNEGKLGAADALATAGKAGNAGNMGVPDWAPFG